MKFKFLFSGGEGSISIAYDFSWRVLFTLSCLIPRRLGTFTHIHKTTNKNNTKNTITINLTLIRSKTGKTMQKNQAQNTISALALKYNAKSY